ncbi:MAG: hypothetical protein JNK71_14945, partial [Methyloversatilis sp.]|nr:hypothetical protein [Methyloversatilis sp.]
MSSNVADLIDALLFGPEVAAIVLHQPLKPLIGRTVYPASYAPPESAGRDGGPRYCITELRDGHNICVIDSIPSQANRVENAWASDPLYRKRPTATVFPSLIQRVIIARTRAPQCCVHKGDHGHKSPNGTRVQARP